MKQPFATPGFLGEGNELGNLMRSKDWTSSPLGTPATWPQSLRSAVSLMLGSEFPMFVIWGKELAALYNDAYASLLGKRHPHALGRPFVETWPEIWSEIEPIIERALAGKASYYENLPLNLERHGYPEQAFFTFSYSPIRDESGAVAGMFCACTETTEHVNAERRQAFQLEISDRLRGLSNPHDMMVSVTRLLGEALRANQVMLGAIDGQQRSICLDYCYTDGMAPQLSGQLELDTFGTGIFEALQAGQTYVVDDILSDARTASPAVLANCRQIGAQSGIAVPIVREKVLQSILVISQAAPRHWSRFEITLAEDVAERTWNAVERARAEAERQEAQEALIRQRAAESRRMRNLFEKAPGFIAVLRGPDHVFDFANASYLQLVGNRDLIGHPAREVIPEAEGQGFFELLDKVYATGKPEFAFEAPLLLQQEAGQPPVQTYVDFVYQPIMEADGSVSGIFVDGYDVTARKVAQENLRSSEDRWKLALEAAGDSIWDWNVKTGEVQYSDGWKAMLGYAPDEMENSFKAWEAIAFADDIDMVMADLQACIAGRKTMVANECRLRCKDGAWIWVLNRGSVVSRDSNGNALRMVGTTTNISDRKRTEQENWERANLDALTGLPNRRLFRDRLEHGIKHSKHHHIPMALLFIDLDRFKEVNDLLGHDAGDALLKQAANRIVTCVRQTDTVARLGGDEFTVILSEIEGAGQVEAVARKILHELACPFHVLNELVHVSGSIGITVCPEDGTEPEDLVRNADQAMYVAKNAGRNQYSRFLPRMQEVALARLKLIGDLRQALPEKQFELYFQPIADLRNGRIVKAEALLRWKHPEKGLVMPSEFIPLAEETGLIKEIGNWVFLEAASWVKRLSDRTGERFQISINKSPVQFTDASLVRNWLQYLKRLGLSAHSITVEITEGVLLNPSQQVTNLLAALHEAGICVAIDDFGTGYSSLAYLQRYDVDYLKIDQSFVKNLASDASSQTIAETIIVMAQKLGLKAIAEGVETVEQRDWLRAAGCDYAQGFFYSEPLPCAEFERLLMREARLLDKPVMGE